MNKTTLIILISVAVVAVAFASGAVGMLIQKQAMAPQIKALNELSQLKSKVIGSVVAYGKVESISGRTVTLKNGTDVLAIKVNDSAQTSSITANGNSAPTQKVVSFSEVKVGNSVSIGVKVAEDGTLNGVSVIIFP